MTEHMPEPSRSTDVVGYIKPLRASVRHHLPRLMRDVLQEPNLAEHSIDDDATWEFYLDNPTAQFRVHNLDHLRSLTETYRESGDLSYARKADVIVRRWLRARGIPDDSKAWHGHEVALRTTMLAYLYDGGFSRGPEMTDALRTHAEHLAKPENYQGAWNHGLDQNIALLQAAEVLELPEFADIATQRLTEAAETYVDAQGVVAEQATSYAAYVHKQLGRAIDELKKAGLEIPPALLRRDRIPMFLAWATRPDGHPVQVGDSLPSPITTVDGPELSFVRSQGMEGTPPAGRSMFYDDGWGFIRSGWGETRAMADESHLTLRYGTFRRIHGHRDHTSLLWFTGGREILSDPGFSTYSDPDVRAHEQLEHAHSQVTLTDAGRFQWMKGTELLGNVSHPVQGDHLHLIRMGGYPYRGLERIRDVLHLPVLGVVVVRDTITAPKEVRALQNWQFGRGLAATTSEDVGVLHLSDDKGLVEVRQHLPVADVTVRVGQSEPLGGWVAVARERRAPAPSVVYEVSGSTVEFLTSFTADGLASVHVGTDGLIRISNAEGHLVAEVAHDPNRGFFSCLVRPREETQWDHRE